MINLKVVKNHKERSASKREKAFRCCQQHTKSSLNKAFSKPLLKVSIRTGNILIDRITKRYSEYL